jgi:hypothetical protein
MPPTISDRQLTTTMIIATTNANLHYHADSHHHQH